MTSEFIEGVFMLETEAWLSFSVVGDLFVIVGGHQLSRFTTEGVNSIDPSARNTEGVRVV